MTALATRVLDRFFTPRMPEPYAGPARRWLLWLCLVAVMLVFPGLPFLSALVGLADVIAGRAVDPLGDYSASGAVLSVAFSALPIGMAWGALRLTGDRLVRIGLLAGPAAETARATYWAFVWIFSLGGVLEFGLGFVLSRIPYADRFSADVQVGTHVSFARLAAIGIPAAISAGLVEEIVVLAFAYRVLERLGWSDRRLVVVLVTLRLSYHLYYGISAVVLLPWAYLSVLFYRRYRRIWPLILGHAGWDTYAILSTASLPSQVVGLGLTVLLVLAAVVLAVRRWQRARRGPLLTLAIPRPRPQWSDSGGRQGQPLAQLPTGRPVAGDVHDLIGSAAPHPEQEVGGRAGDIGVGQSSLGSPDRDRLGHQGDQP